MQMLTESYEACFKGNTGKTNVYSEIDLYLKYFIKTKTRIIERTPIKKLSLQKERYHQRVKKRQPC